MNFEEAIKAVEAEQDDLMLSRVTYHGPEMIDHKTDPDWRKCIADRDELAIIVVPYHNGVMFTMHLSALAESVQSKEYRRARRKDFTLGLVMGGHPRAIHLCFRQKSRMDYHAYARDVWPQLSGDEIEKIAQEMRAARYIFILPFWLPPEIGEEYDELLSKALDAVLV